MSTPRTSIAAHPVAQGKVPMKGDNVQEKTQALLRLRAEGKTIKEAAQIVGLEYPTARSYCSRYRVKLAQMAAERFQDEAPEMIDTLCGMIRNASTPANTRLAAIRDWLDRAGYQVTQKHEVGAVELRGLSDEELHQRILERCHGDEEAAARLIEAVRTATEL